MEPLQDLITHLGCPFDEQRGSACHHDSLPSSSAWISARDCQLTGTKFVIIHVQESSVSSEWEFYFPHFQMILWKNERKLKMILQAEKHCSAWGWVLEALTEWSIRRKLRFLREERKLVLCNPVRGVFVHDSFFSVRTFPSRPYTHHYKCELNTEKLCWLS